MATINQFEDFTVQEILNYVLEVIEISMSGYNLRDMIEAKDGNPSVRDETLDIINGFSESARKVVFNRIDLLKDEAREALKKRLAGEVADLGFSIDELFESPKSKRVSIASPKYRNPGNYDQTWSGRGKRPSWLVDCLVGGETLESMLIPADPVNLTDMVEFKEL